MKDADFNEALRRSFKGLEIEFNAIVEGYIVSIFIPKYKLIVLHDEKEDTAKILKGEITTKVQRGEYHVLRVQTHSANIFDELGKIHDVLYCSWKLARKPFGSRKE